MSQSQPQEAFEVALGHSVGIPRRLSVANRQVTVTWNAIPLANLPPSWKVIHTKSHLAGAESVRVEGSFQDHNVFGVGKLSPDGESFDSLTVSSLH